MSPAAVSSSGLTKRFGKQVAVDHIDLDVPAGSVYGFLGPNGSGKTTTIRMLLGLVRPTEGSSAILGRPVPQGLDLALPRVGALIEGPAFHTHLSGRANLVRLDAADATADPATCDRRVADALERVGLTNAAGKSYRAYSLGMKQRLAIAAALLQPRDLLVLDEPTNGLDPQGTREVRHIVSSLAEEGSTVLVSSHLLSEIEQMCSHVGVMSRGRLVTQDSLETLRDRARAHVELHTPDVADALRCLDRLGLLGTVPGDKAPDGTVVFVPGQVPTERIVSDLVADGVRVRAFNVVRPTLEDLFVSLTGEGFDVNG
ncbi:ABC transporter ATP-binding protein [Brooklawnia cerclae]|uniref:ABC-2 type transport system ATP-binding protein n=1 Tax=Brooklawnia cerclae TaxID=349934 RepID=A0ABX0SJ66_9ACTN|nr:ABC-2 type transport system ATP-binding protein [Brooklawnia cerclae]